MNPETDSNAPAAKQAQGFIATLFDFSFSSFITTKFIKIIYGIALLGAALGVLAFILAGFSGGFMQGIFCLIVSPIVAGLYLIAVRMGTEMMVVGFRIAEYLRSIDSKLPPK